MAGIVWTVRKVHHMIQAARTTTVIWTDHSAIAGIANQTKLSSSNTDKLNLRLVRVSTYLSQFDICIKHKAGRDHVIPDALSRLPAKQDAVLKPSAAVANTQAYSSTIAELSEPFKRKFLDAYKEKKWAAIWTDLEAARKIAARRVETSQPATPAADAQHSHKKKMHGASFKMFD